MTRLLIADDQPIVREGVRSLLRGVAGIEVVGEADDFPSTLQALAEQPVDVVLLDISMPGGAILSFLDQLSASHPDVRALVFSMHVEDAFTIRLLRAGAKGYLSKDRATDQLIDAIRTVAAGQRYIPMALAEELLRQVEGGSALPHHDLTQREYQVFRELVRGQRVTDIADLLNVSAKTVSTHKTRLMAKMGLRSTAALTKYALRHDLL